MNFPLAARLVMIFAISGSASAWGQAASGERPVIVQPGAPGQPSKVLPAGTRPPAPQIAAADVEFVQGMIMHHGQAVEMCALIPSHTDNADVRTLGAKISSSQQQELAWMKQWLTERNEPTSMAMPGMPDMDMSGAPMKPMPGMLTPAQMDALRRARGHEFDVLFLKGMMQHHGGALTMVKDLFNAPGAGQDADLFNFATDVDNGQRAEIRIMAALLKKINAGG